MGKCRWCNDEFEGEEIDAPMIYKGEKICDDCYDVISFPCAICEETMDDENVNHFVVLEDGFGVEKGFYLIIDYPYYSGSVLGDQRIISSNVKKIKELSGEEPESNGGHICKNCSDEIMKEVAGDGSG